MDVFRFAIGILSFAVMGSLAYHIGASPYVNDAVHTDDIPRIISTWHYRLSEFFASIGMFACLAWGFGKMFIVLPRHWGYESDDGSFILYGDALGFLISVIASAVLLQYWRDFQSLSLEKRLRRAAQLKKERETSDRGRL